MKLTFRGTLTGVALFLLFGTTPAVGQVSTGAAEADAPYDGASNVFADDPAPSILADDCSPDCGSGCCSWYGCCYEPTCYVEADALFLHRTRTSTIKLVEDDSEDSQTQYPYGHRPSLLTTDALKFDYEWGPRILFGWRLNQCRRIEVGYYGLHHWRTAAALVVPSSQSNLRLPFDRDRVTVGEHNENLHDWDDARSVAVSYTSELHNVEANYLCDDPCRCFAPLIGFRYFNLNEQFDVEARDSNDTSDYSIDTDNHLVGCQLGATVDRCVTRRFRLRFDGTAGLYVNFARQHTWLGDQNNQMVLRNFTNDQGELAFVGELRLGGVYHLTQCVALTAGYQVLWVEGVALAPEQLDFTTTAVSGSQLNDDGGVFYDGGYVGVQVMR